MRELYLLPKLMHNGDETTTVKFSVEMSCAEMSPGMTSDVFRIPSGVGTRQCHHAPVSQSAGAT